MDRCEFQIGGLTNFYYISGSQPELYIDCGTHGDEYGIVPLVEKAVLKYEKELPSFIYVPVVCPSGVSLKTRENKDGIDLNRSFLKNSMISEVQFLAKVMSDYNFKLSVTWHEDPTKDVVYLYDTGTVDERDLVGFRRRVRLLDAPLFTGFGWEGTEAKRWKDDPVLEGKIIKGYVANSPSKNTSENGEFATWSVTREHTQRVINPEIGTGFTPEMKEKLIEVFFEEIVLPLSRQKYG